MRVGENCQALTGFINRAGDSTYAAAVNANRSADASVLLVEENLVVERFTKTVTATLSIL